MTQNNPLLRLEHVSKEYGNQTVLNDVSTTIASGDFVAMVGMSGGGKSTLLRLIAGLESPTNGQVSQQDRIITELNTDSRTMFQDDRLLPWMTVRDNLTFGNHTPQSIEHANDLLARVDLSSFAESYPTDLSGGQKQRVALARALMSHPKLLLLDEPLGALDAFTRRKMQDLILDIWRQEHLAVILVTHDVTEAARMANKVFVIKNHRLAWQEHNALNYPRNNSQAVAAVADDILSQVIA